MTDHQVPFDPPASATALTPVPPGGPGAPAVVAFYLPQYHRIPENDAWWGEGFTDWRNVTAARPLYPGHAISNLPGELGAYDLLSRDVRSAQAELAREHGVYGFCYYFYWFGGRRLLQRPLELMLEDGQPDLPFALCWANEPWTRRWDGREQDVLMPQHHDRVRDLAILDDLMPYFEDPRYIRIDGRPLLLIYRQGLMPDAPGFAADLRAEAVRQGLPGLFLCNVLSIGDIERCAPGFDAAVEFPPQGTLGREMRPRSLNADPAFKGHIYDYASTVETAIARPIPSFPCFPGVMPRWDNTARKGLRAHIFHGSTPESFGQWLRKSAMVARRLNPRAPLVFVNSWNEWAEGAHLEPDLSSGDAYLEATRRVITAWLGDWREVTAGVVRTDPAARLQPNGHERLYLHEPPSVRSLQAGLPIVGHPIGMAHSEGAAWIESVDGRPANGAMVTVERGSPVRVRGWFLHIHRIRMRRPGHTYLVMSAGGNWWHAPVPDRVQRVDLRRAMVARDRTARRRVRLVDRLPASIGGAVLRMWTWRRDAIGINVDIDVDGLPPGRYNIDFAQLTASTLNVVTTGSVLELR